MVLVVAVAWLGFQAVRAFDQDRHAREAAAVLAAPDTVTHPLPPAPGGVPDAVTAPAAGSRTGPGPGCRWWSWRVSNRSPGTSGIWCSCATGPGGRWPGRPGPGPTGTAQVRSAAEPRPATVYEVVVTRAVDDATSIPHGQPVLQWFDASLGPPRARRFDFALGV